MDAEDKAKILNYAMDRAQRYVANDTPARSANMASTAENGEPPAEDGDTGTPDTTLEANETQTQISDTKASTHPGDLRRMMSSKGSRKAFNVAWSAHTTTRASPTSANTTTRASPTSSSDAWGAETGSASSQLPAPPTPFSFSDDLDQFGLASTTESTDELDLLGRPNTTAPIPTSTGNHNPFTPQYDPFADIWAKDNESHFC